MAYTSSYFQLPQHRKQKVYEVIDKRSVWNPERDQQKLAE